MNIIVAYFENLTHVVGGLEKVICEFSNEFYRRGNQVTIVTFDQSEGRPYYPLPSEVQIMNLRDKTAHLSGMEKICREMYRVFGHAAARTWKMQWKQRHGICAFSRLVERIKPDVIISFEPMTSAEIVREGIHVPLISSIQNDPSVRFPDLSRKERQALEVSSAVHVLMPSFMTTVKNFISQYNVISIPNIIPQCAKPVDLGKRNGPFRIINVARLNKKQKRQEILIDAFALLAHKYPEWTVEFWGSDTSNYKEELESKIQKYHLEKQVFLRGITHNVSEIYQQADIFAFPSKSEGFGLALGEAMSAGLPAVGFASCSAVNELIQNGISGFLTMDSIEAFAEALENLMQCRELRARMGAAAHEEMKGFAAEKIWQQWEDLIKESIESY